MQSNKQCKILIVFYYMIADVLSNKTFNSIITELFIRSRKLNFSLDFITQLYSKVQKDVRLSTKHFVTMKRPNKREHEQIAFNHSSDIDFKDLFNPH